MTRDTDLIRRGDAMDLRDELADVIGARPLSSIHSALSEYRKAISTLPAHPVQEPPSPGVTAGATGPVSDADFLRDAGMDGAKWAAGFKAIAERLGHHGMDEGWLIGWFCNAIMAGYDEAERRYQNATPAPVVPADQRAAIEALADRMWRVHPKDIFDAGYEHIDRGGKYDNPRAAWYADQIEALFKQFQDQASPVVTADSLAMARFDLEQATRQIENDHAALMHLCRKHGMVGDLPMQWLDERLSAPPVGARVTWVDITDQQPPKDQPFLARNQSFAAFIAEWSETDQEYLTLEDADGWQAIYFSHWLPIPDLPAALLPAGEGK